MGYRVQFHPHTTGQVVCAIPVDADGMPDFHPLPCGLDHSIRRRNDVSAGAVIVY